MVRRSDIKGATEREKVFALLHSFDDRGMTDTEFEWLDFITTISNCLRVG
jgi:hypothetical protein